MPTHATPPPGHVERAPPRPADRRRSTTRRPTRAIHAVPVDSCETVARAHRRRRLRRRYRRPRGVQSTAADGTTATVAAPRSCSSGRATCPGTPPASPVGRPRRRRRGSPARGSPVPTRSAASRTHASPAVAVPRSQSRRPAARRPPAAPRTGNSRRSASCADPPRRALRTSRRRYDARARRAVLRIRHSLCCRHCTCSSTSW